MTTEDRPLYYRCRWSADDKNRLTTEVMRGGDWAHRAAKSLGRTAISCHAQARRMLKDEGTPVGFGDRVAAGYVYIRAEIDNGRTEVKRKRTQQETDRMKGAFSAVSGYRVPYAIERRANQTVVIVPPEEPPPPPPREPDVIVQVTVPRFLRRIVRKIGGK
jgi:transposase-like protein